MKAAELYQGDAEAGCCVKCDCLSLSSPSCSAYFAAVASLCRQAATFLVCCMVEATAGNCYKVPAATVGLVCRHAGAELASTAAAAAKPERAAA